MDDRNSITAVLRAVALAGDTHQRRCSGVRCTVSAEQLIRINHAALESGEDNSCGKGCVHMRVERSWNRWKAIPPVHAYFGGEGTALGEHRQPVAARSVLVRQRSYRPRLMLQCLSTPVLATKRDRSSTPADRGSQGRGRAARDARSAVVPARRGTVMESDDLIAAAPAPCVSSGNPATNRSNLARIFYPGTGARWDDPAVV